MATMTHGASPTVKPTFCARNNRNASENRASVSTAAIATTTQNSRGNRFASDHARGARGLPSARAVAADFGSSTPKMMTITHTTAGTQAIQKAAWKFPANHAIAPIATSGPPIAPTVSSAWRKPKDRKSTRLNSSHVRISYAVFCLKKKNNNIYFVRSQQKKKKKHIK